ncbi:FxLYD domain-containing protein [Streptomyces sp. SYSU K21746]
MSHNQPPGQQPPQGWGQPQQQPGQQWGQQPTGPGWGGPPPQPRKSNTGKVIGFSCLGVVGLVVVLGIVGALVSGGDGDKPESSSVATSPGGGAQEEAPAAPEQKEPEGPEGDVKITSCDVEPTLKWPSASVTITNRSSDTSNYIVTVEFLDAQGVRIGEGLAATNNLASGKVAKEKAQGTADATGKITCKVTDVTRYAS